MNKKEAIAKFKLLELFLEKLEEQSKAEVSMVLYRLTEDYANFLCREFKSKPYLFNLIKDYKNTFTYKWLKDGINRDFSYWRYCPRCNGQDVERNIGYVQAKYCVYQECQKCGQIFNALLTKK